MELVFSLFVAVIVVIIIKLLLDYLGVPRPINWIVVLLIAVVLVWYLMKNPIAV
jgi:multisubunit Na+/H+ antiporter MnhE subunit